MERTRAEKQTADHAIVTAIAEHLGMVADPIDPDAWVRYYHARTPGYQLGAALGLSFEFPEYPKAAQGRISVAPCWPHSRGAATVQLPRDHGLASVSGITVSASKDPATIAADIKRRLMPEYAVAHAAILANIEEIEEARARAVEYAQRLAAEIGGKVYERDGRVTVQTPGHDTIGVSTTRKRLSDKVTLEVSRMYVDFDRGLAAVKALVAARKEG